MAKMQPDRFNASGSSAPSRTPDEEISGAGKVAGAAS